MSTNNQQPNQNKTQNQPQVQKPSKQDGASNPNRKAEEQQNKKSSFKEFSQPHKEL